MTLSPDVVQYLFDLVDETGPGPPPSTDPYTPANPNQFVRKKALAELAFLAGVHIPDTVGDVASNPIVDVVKRSCYLIFKESSKGVGVTAKPPSVAPGEISVRVDVSIPNSLFSPTQLRVKVDLPESAGLSPEAIVDLQQAVGMSYGKAVQLIVEPANHGAGVTENSS